MTKLYQNIQIIRKRRKIKSIRQLEISSGIPVGTIRKWKDRSPGIEHLIKLSTYLKISMESLLGINENDLSHEVIHDENLEKVIGEIASLDLNVHTVNIVIKVLQAVASQDDDIDSDLTSNSELSID